MCLPCRPENSILLIGEKIISIKDNEMDIFFIKHLEITKKIRGGLARVQGIQTLGPLLL